MPCQLKIPALVEALKGLDKGYLVYANRRYMICFGIDSHLSGLYLHYVSYLVKILVVLRFHQQMGHFLEKYS